MQVDRQTYVQTYVAAQQGPGVGDGVVPVILHEDLQRGRSAAVVMLNHVTHEEQREFDCWNR